MHSFFASPPVLRILRPAGSLSSAGRLSGAVLRVPRAVVLGALIAGLILPLTRIPGLLFRQRGFLLLALPSGIVDAGGAGEELFEIARQRFGLLFPNEILFVPEDR